MIHEHGPSPISGDTYMILYDFVRQGQREAFNDLALMIGIDRGQLDSMWDHLSEWPA